MARSAVTDGGKRDEIIASAMGLFLKNGFDGTSIRSIMKKANGEVGLFYYYFKDKNDVFDKVLDLFFEGYKKHLAEIANGSLRDPFRAMTRFFEYIRAETIQFREKYAENIHKTVRWAIRERTLTIITPYIRQIIDVLTQMGANPPLELDVTAVMLSHGVGSMILHEDSKWMEKIKGEVQNAVYLIMGIELKAAELMFPAAAQNEDVFSVTELAERMKEYFPGFEKNAFEAQLKEKVKKGEVLIIRHNGNAAGCIAFSRGQNEIDFLAVDKNYRGCGIAARLMITAMSEFPVGAEVSVVTYREGDALAADARSFYKKFGFCEGDEFTAFDYPCRRLYVTVPKSAMIMKSRNRE